MGRKLGSPKELRRICQPQPKGSGIDAAVERIVLRGLSIYITWGLLHTPITANQVTVLLIVIGLVGSLLLAFGDQWLSILGALMLFLHLVLDYVDGEVARCREASSPVGRYLDLVTHKIVNPMVFAGLSFGVYHNDNTPGIFAFGFLASAARMWVRDVRRIALRVLGDGRANYGALEEMAATRRSPLFDRIRSLGLHKFVCETFGIQTAILVGAVVNRLDIVVIFYGVVLPVLAIWQVYWWFRVIKSSRPVLDAESAFTQSQDLSLTG